MKIKILIILLFFNLSVSYGQNNFNDLKNNVQVDTIFNQNLKWKFQRYVDVFLEENKTDLNEISVIPNLLDTKEKVAKFSMNLILIRYPMINEDVFTEVHVSEDKSSKIWFVDVRNSIGYPVHLIVFKTSCRVIYFFKVV